MLLGASDPATIRAAGAYSLLETTASQGWHLGVALERALRRRVPMIGTSLVHTLPRLTGMLRGYPYEEESVERLVDSPVRHVFGAMPGSIRRRVLRTIPASRGISAAFSGPPSVAHAEALLRGTEERARSLGEPLDALCLGIPGRRRTCRASGRTRCSRRTSGSAWRCGSGATRSRSSTAARRSSSIRSSGGSRIRASSRTATSSARFAPDRRVTPT